VAAGKHVYIEKPLAMDLVQAERMAAALDAAGLKGGMTFNFRFYPAAMRARQLMDEGFPGRIYSFYARYHRSGYISPSRPSSWRLRRDVSGGGSLYDLGAHVLDLIRWLLGDVAEINATLETLVRERPVKAGATETAPVDVDDLALLQMRLLRDGALGTAEFSRMGTGAVNDLRLEIFGELGAIKLSLEEPDWLEIYDARTPDRPLGGARGFTRVETVQRFDGAVSPDWTMPMGFVRSHAECQYRFLRAVWDGSAPSPDLHDGVAVQRLLAAAELSSAEKRWVSGNELHELHE
jgi:predicted dehydrogenase